MDLDKTLVYSGIVQTNLRPDIILWSQTGKTPTVVELTVPWDFRCEEAYERKRAKYTELREQCRQQGWKAWLCPTEVGARGFYSQSVCRLMSAIGTTGKYRRRSIQRLSQTAEHTFCYQWPRREEKSRNLSTSTPYMVGPPATRMYNVLGSGPQHFTKAGNKLMMEEDVQ